MSAKTILPSGGDPLLALVAGGKAYKLYGVDIFYPGVTRAFLVVPPYSISQREIWLPTEDIGDKTHTPFLCIVYNYVI